MVYFSGCIYKLLSVSSLCIFPSVPPDDCRLKNPVDKNGGDSPVSPISLRETQARENPLYSPVDLSADPAPKPRDPSEMLSTETNPATVHTTSNSRGSRIGTTSTSTSQPQGDSTSASLEKYGEGKDGGGSLLPARTSLRFICNGLFLNL